MTDALTTDTTAATATTSTTGVTGGCSGGRSVTKSTSATSGGSSNSAVYHTLSDTRSLQPLTHSHSDSQDTYYSSASSGSSDSSSSSRSYDCIHIAISDPLLVKQNNEVVKVEVPEKEEEVEEKVVVDDDWLTNLTTAAAKTEAIAARYRTTSGGNSGGNSGSGSEGNSSSSGSGGNRASSSDGCPVQNATNENDSMSKWMWNGRELVWNDATKAVPVEQKDVYSSGGNKSDDDDDESSIELSQSTPSPTLVPLSQQTLPHATAPVSLQSPVSAVSVPAAAVAVVPVQAPSSVTASAVDIFGDFVVPNALVTLVNGPLPVVTKTYGGGNTCAQANFGSGGSDTSGDNKNDCNMSPHSADGTKVSNNDSNNTRSSKSGTSSNSGSGSGGKENWCISSSNSSSSSASTHIRKRNFRVLNMSPTRATAVSASGTSALSAACVTQSQVAPAAESEDWLQELIQKRRSTNKSYATTSSTASGISIIATKKKCVVVTSGGTTNRTTNSGIDVDQCKNKTIAVAAVIVAGSTTKGKVITDYDITTRKTQETVKTTTASSLHSKRKFRGST